MEASWSSFDATMQVDAEDSELLAQLLGTYEGQSLDIPSLFWPADPSAADSYYCAQDFNASLCYWPEESSISFSTSADYRSGCYLGQPDVVDPAMGGATSSPMDFGMVADHQMIPSSSSMDLISMNEETSSEELGDLCMNVPDQHIVLCDQKPMQLKRKLHVELDDCNASRHEIPDSLVESPKKKARASSQVQKSVKGAKSMKARKSIKSGEEEESNVAPYGHSFSSYSSEEDSNVSQELSIGGSASTSPKGPAALAKTRAGRGSATDPQSLYARKRREKINERLRILQNLVPNGTKVDISTMLEAAVQYVEFLQLQIKLLSSNEMWMYAPIAYNGINIGFDLNMTPAKQ